MRKLLVASLLVIGAVGMSAQTSREKAEALLSKLTLDEKISLMMDASPAIPRLDIPQFNWWSEALHGVARAGLATVFPQTIGMAATFDDEAVGETFDIVSDEARAKFNGFRTSGNLKRYQCLAFWTPNVNIFRDPRWGRGQETYGEDPYLTSRMGAAVVNGLQGPKGGKYMKALAGAKHFAVHSGPEWNRHSFDAKDIDPRDLWETYLPAFKALVDEDVAQVMCAYNRYEGEPCCSSKKLLQQILRSEWGYKNIIVSDCWAIRDFTDVRAHNTHPSDAHASADAVISGTDLECGPMYKNLRTAYEKGLITEAVIDSAVVKLLDYRYRLGEMDAAADVPWNSYTAATHLNTPEHAAKALEMARKSMTLLKNNGILPLDPKAGKKIYVMGPNANDSVMQWGNYNGSPAHTITVLEGVRSYVPGAVYERGCAHVVSENMVSQFDKFDGGMKASYWNGHDASGAPVATAVHTAPIHLDGGGATVFAPGVELTNFCGVYKGTFVAPADGDYIITYDASRGDESILLDGKEVMARSRDARQDHKASYLFSTNKGCRHDIEVRMKHYDGEATLNFDLLAADAGAADFADADIVIFVGGISPQLEGEEMKVSVPGFRGGDRETIELPNVQRQLIKKIKDAGKKVVYVNCSGSAVALAPENEICDAVLQAWYPGQAGGQAVAEVLFGDYNPGGRLPITFYKDDSQLPDFEDYSMVGRTYRYFKGEPLYPFGYGLSYTTFEYGKPKFSSTKVKAGEPMKLTVPVSNTGKMDGDEVVMVYVSCPADVSGPIKNLKGFKRVHIPAGKTEKVEITLDGDAFSVFDNETQRVIPRPGKYIVHLPSSQHEVIVK